MTRRIYLVRHGETEGESSIRYHGRNDVPLSEHGRAQVRALVPWLCEVAFSAVVHSPLSRAAESARILVDALASSPGTVEAEAGFREIDFGQIEGMTDAEVRQAMPDWHRAWRAGEVEGFPGGDTLAGFTARVARAWDAVLARHPAGDLLVVVHRGVIKRVLQHGAGVTPSRAEELDVDLASLTVLRGGTSLQVELLNRVPC